MPKASTEEKETVKKITVNFRRKMTSLLNTLNFRDGATNKDSVVKYLDRAKGIMLA